MESSAQLLDNGHILIGLGDSGRIIEVDEAGNVYWEYQNPVYFEPIPQFDPLDGQFRIFRAEKYAIDYPAFEGRDLTHKGLVENENSISDECWTATPVTEPEQPLQLLFPNPASDRIQLQFKEPIEISSLHCYNIYGQIVKEKPNLNWSGSLLQVDLKGLSTGIYVLQFREANRQWSYKISIQQ